MNRLCLAALAAMMLGGCQNAGGDTFTLYRDSVFDPSMRIHVASFDSNEGAIYNSENCDLAVSLFQGQIGVATRFWCEKGRYQK